MRVRPAVRKSELDANEGDKGSTSAIHCQGPKLWLLEDGLGGDKAGKGGQDAKTRQFVFDGSLSPESTQADVYRYAPLSAHPSIQPPGASPCPHPLGRAALLYMGVPARPHLLILTRSTC